MTIFGPDLASYQAGLDVATLTDAAFVTAKCTEGATYVNPDYEGWRTSAKGAGKVFWWYHFLVTTSSPAAQAAHVKTNCGDPTLPGMVDFEPEAGSQPSFAFLVSCIDALVAEGLHPKLVYAPQWYIDQLGVTDLTALTSRGILLVSSDYPGAAGTGPNQYAADGGDEGAGWKPYANVKPSVVPTIWQFTDRASEGGQLVDYNAFRGTADELAALLKEPPPTVSAPAPPSNPYPQIQQGSAGDAVRTAQKLLNEHAYGLAVDGQFGPATKSATQDYQRNHSLLVDGIIGAHTWASLLAGTTGRPYPGAETREGDTGPLVRTCQQELLTRGFNPDGVDGQFGAHTKAAVEGFQSRHSLQVDGVIGPHTWTALFS